LREAVASKRRQRQLEESSGRLVGVPRLVEEGLHQQKGRPHQWLNLTPMQGVNTRRPSLYQQQENTFKEAAPKEKPFKRLKNKT
jgi:hypothetical protein